MAWFAHKHWWRLKVQPCEIKGESGAVPMGMLLVEDCSCGAVRTIEIMAGEPPRVRIARCDA
jgi:hypothetical protein